MGGRALCDTVFGALLDADEGRIETNLPLHTKLISGNILLV